MVYKLELGTVAWVAGPGMWDLSQEGVDGLDHYSINLTSDHTATYGCVCELCNSVFKAFINMGGSTTTLNESHLTGIHSFWIRRSNKGPKFAHCRLCSKDINIESMGGRALTSHAEGIKHQKCEAAAKRNKAEVMWTIYTVYRNNSF